MACTHLAVKRDPSLRPAHRSPLYAAFAAWTLRKRPAGTSIRPGRPHPGILTDPERPGRPGNPVFTGAGVSFPTAGLPAGVYRIEVGRGSHREGGIICITP